MIQDNENYTKIPNQLLEALMKADLLSTELAICLVIIRKTYGYNKSEDSISLTQFQEAVQRTRPTVVKAIKRLKLVNIVKLVKSGNSKISSNVWALNKNVDEWQLVNSTELVNDIKLVKHDELVKPDLSTKSNLTSKVLGAQLVKTSLPTKEIINKINIPPPGIYISPPQTQAEAKPVPKRKTAFPESFELTPEMRAWGASFGLDLDQATEHFRDHHTAKGSTFLDWKAAWRTWMRNSVNFKKPGDRDASFENRTEGLKKWFNRTTQPSNFFERNGDPDNSIPELENHGGESRDHVPNASRFKLGETSAGNPTLMPNPQGNISWNEPDSDYPGLCAL